MSLREKPLPQAGLVGGPRPSSWDQEPHIPRVLQEALPSLSLRRTVACAWLTLPVKCGYELDKWPRPRSQNIMHLHHAQHLQ